jgi:hypothetical protein
VSFVSMQGSVMMNGMLRRLRLDDIVSAPCLRYASARAAGPT